jgi:ElaB/YqjD/DUF883 family membrane-anchored ribosome-binding protein
MDLTKFTLKDLRTIKQNAENLLESPSEKKKAEAAALMPKILTEIEKKSKPTKRNANRPYQWEKANAGATDRKMRNRYVKDDGTLVASITQVATHGTHKTGEYHVEIGSQLYEPCQGAPYHPQT